MIYNNRFFIGAGNNFQILKNAMKVRQWWLPTAQSPQDFVDCNFVWTCWKKDKYIDSLKKISSNELGRPIRIYGRMDNNKHLITKKGIFVNMREYYSKRNIDPFSVLPLTFLVTHVND